jgi:ABC-type Mn2+/Zn2+ transport system ATPase subunit
VILAERLVIRGSPALPPVTFGWGPGVHALLGGPPNVAGRLLATIAGVAAPRSGAVRVLGGDPRAPHVRACIGYVPRQAVLPGGLRVDEALALATTLRGGTAARAAHDVLEPFGLQALAARRTDRLSPASARAVALAEALTAPEVRALVVHEPFVDVDERALPQLARRLHDLAAREGCVVIASASSRDAHDLTDDVISLAPRPPKPPQPGAPNDVPYAHVVSSDPQRLLAALADDPACVYLARAAAAVHVAAGTEEVLAAAVARAVHKSGVDVVELRIETGPAS